MALTIKVTKKQVDYVMPKLNSVTLTLSLSEDGKEVLSKDFSYHLPDGDLTSAKSVNVADQMQEEIDRYKKSQDILKTKIDVVAEEIQAKLKI